MQTRRRLAAWTVAAVVFSVGSGVTIYWLARRFHDPGLIGLAAGIATVAWAGVAATCFGVLRPRS